MAPRKKQYTRAVTLVEVMMVLGVMAFLLGLVMTIMAIVQSNRIASEIKEEILSIQDAANQLAVSRVDFGNVTTQTLIDSGFIPKKYISGNSLVTPTGGIIVIVNFNIDGNDVANGDRLNFWMLGLSQQACDSIVSTDYTGISYSLNANWKLDTGGVAYTPEQVARSCMTGNNNEIGMNLKKQ